MQCADAKALVRQANVSKLRSEFVRTQESPSANPEEYDAMAEWAYGLLVAERTKFLTALDEILRDIEASGVDKVPV